MNTDRVVNVFISYSWDSLEHREWVEKLAIDLEQYSELHVTWDGFDLDAGVDKNYFMEKNVSNSDYICVVSTNKYKDKANLREGGVGIETFLTSAVHWEDMEKTGKSRLIVLRREKDSIPDYLKGRMYKDFSDDNTYQKSLNDLVAFFAGAGMTKRPQKMRSIYSGAKNVFSFTKLEELVKLNSSKRECVIGSDKGTDFSGKNKIKYEVWKTYNPSVNYIVGLADNISVSQTLNRVVDVLKGADPGATITILRPRLRGNDQTETKDFFISKGIKNEVYEYTYRNYIWEFCIGDELGDLSMPDGIPSYTDQPLVEVGSGKTMSSALDEMINRVSSDYGGSAHLVVGSGGMGKTSLCVSLAKKLFNRTDWNLSVIFLQADAIKKYVSERGMVFQEIRSLYQLYDIYTKYQDIDNVLTKAAFELAVLCGNIVVVIDGLDEIDGAFEDGFNLDRFFSSLKDIYSQMGASRVILTSRDSALISQDTLNKYGIEQYNLLGFDDVACERYVRSRFRQYDESDQLTSKAMGKISSIGKVSDEDGRIVPFFADVVANVMEEEISSGDKHVDLKLINSETPYGSNNDIIDHLVFSILKRETVRQEIGIDEVDVVEFFGEMVADYGKRWKSEDMQERLQLLYDERANVLFRKFSRSPLLKDWGDSIELRYSFLENYFLFLHILSGIFKSSKSRSFIVPLAKVSIESAEFKDFLRYFNGRQAELVGFVKSIVRGLVKDINGGDLSGSESEYYKRAISVLLKLAVDSGVAKRGPATKVIKEIYSLPQNGGGVLKGVFVKGDFPDLDFGDLTISNSGFEGYKKFLASRFSNTNFMYSTFKDCANDAIKSSDVEEGMFDKSCELGDLQQSLEVAVDRRRLEKKKLEEDVRRFLGSFYKGAGFRENNAVHIRYTNSYRALSRKGFNLLISNNFISVKEKKEVDTFYEVSGSFKESVRKFLNEGYSDGQMKRFMAFVSES